MFSNLGTEGRKKDEIKADFRNYDMRFFTADCDKRSVSWVLLFLIESGGPESERHCITDWNIGANGFG